MNKNDIIHKFNFKDAFPNIDVSKMNAKEIEELKNFRYYFKNLSEHFDQKEYDENVRLANYVFEKYYKEFDADRDDLISCGVLDIYKLWPKYDPKLSKKSTYKCFSARRGMHNFLRQKYKLNRKESDLDFDVVSFDANYSENSDDNGTATLADIIADDNPQYNIDNLLLSNDLQKCFKSTLKKVCAKRSAVIDDKAEYASDKEYSFSKERIIIDYFETQNCSETGRRLGVSRERVRQVKTQFIEEFKLQYKKYDNELYGDACI